MENGKNIIIIVILLQSGRLHFYKSSRVRIVRSVASASNLQGLLDIFISEVLQ